MALVAGCAPRAHHHDRVNARNGCQHRLARYFLSCGHRPLMSHTLSFSLSGSVSCAATHAHTQERSLDGGEISVSRPRSFDQPACVRICVYVRVWEREREHISKCMCGERWRVTISRTYEVRGERARERDKHTGSLFLGRCFVEGSSAGFFMSLLARREILSVLYNYTRRLSRSLSFSFPFSLPPLTRARSLPRAAARGIECNRAQREREAAAPGPRCDPRMDLRIRRVPYAYMCIYAHANGLGVHLYAIASYHTPAPCWWNRSRGALMAFSPSSCAQRHFPSLHPRRLLPPLVLRCLRVRRCSAGRREKNPFR